MQQGYQEGAAIGVRKGSWTEEEDILLRLCIEKYGEGNWRQVPRRAGLNRCRKSCRLRWVNYLHPSINRREFGHDEVDLIKKFHKLLGNSTIARLSFRRWSMIARRLPGRTANDVKNYWNTHLRKPSSSSSHSPQKSAAQEEVGTAVTETTPTFNAVPEHKIGHEVIKPQPRTLKKSWTWSAKRSPSSSEHAQKGQELEDGPRTEADDWWKHFLPGEDDADDMDTFFCKIWGSGSVDLSSDQFVPNSRQLSPEASAGGPMTLDDLDPSYPTVQLNDFSLDNSFWNM